MVERVIRASKALSKTVLPDTNFLLGGGGMDEPRGELVDGTPMPLRRLAMIIDWIVRQPFTKRHPHLTGTLFGLGLIVFLLIVMPPVFWLLSWFGWLFKPIAEVVTWWFRLWGVGT